MTHMLVFFAIIYVNFIKTFVYVATVVISHQTRKIYSAMTVHRQSLNKTVTSAVGKIFYDHVLQN